MGSSLAFLVAAAVALSAVYMAPVSPGVGDSDGALAPPAPIQGVVVYDSDLNVTNTLRFLNATIYLTGNLTVKSTGYLELVNTTLLMNLTSSGQFRIKVEGVMSVDDLDGDRTTEGDASRIMSNYTGRRYAFSAEPSSRLYFNNSLVRDCGSSGLNTGMSVSTPSAWFQGMEFRDCYHGLYLKAAAKVNNSRFLNCQYGLFVYFSGPRLTNLTVTGSLTRGIYLYYSAPTLSGCLLEGNRVGLYLQNCNSDVVNCTVADSTDAGVVAWYSSPLLEDCALSNGLDMDVRLNSLPRLLDTSLNMSRVSVSAGLYVSVGRRMSALVVNSTGQPLPNISVSVLDSEGNPASQGTTDGSGIAEGLVYRECFITAHGVEQMASHRVMAFSSVSHNVTFGENDTALGPGSCALVTAEHKPEGYEIWMDGETVADGRLVRNSTVIALGDILVPSGGVLELENSTLMMFTQLTKSIQCSSGTLIARNSTVMSIGNPSRLTPSLTAVSADQNSPVLLQDSAFRWVSEFSVRSQSAAAMNLSIEYASATGLKFESCSPTVDGLSIAWAPTGLYLLNDHARVSNLTVTDSRDYAVYASQSSAAIGPAQVSDSGRGLFSYYGNLCLEDFTASGCEYGALSTYTNMLANDSSFVNCAEAGMHLTGGKITLNRPALADSDTGIHAVYTTVWAEAASIAGNNIGLWSEGCAPVLLNSSLSNELDVRTERGSSAALVNCTLDCARTSVEPSGWIDIGNWTAVLVEDQAGQPVPACNVSVRDSADRVSSSGLTGPDGTAHHLAYREKRMLWNRTESAETHTVAAFGGPVATSAGANVTGLSPGGTARVSVAGSVTLVIWPGAKTVSEDLDIIDSAVIAMAGVTVNGGAALRMRGTRLWFYSQPKANTAMDIYDGSFSLDSGTLMPLSASAPLQPTRLWLTYRAGSAGYIVNSSICGISQVTAYTGGLTLRDSSLSFISGTGLQAQSCSPVLRNVTFSNCFDGFWSNGGSPAASDCTFLECAENGLYFNGGNPELFNVTSGGSQTGFAFAEGATGQAINCTAVGNGCGFFMLDSSPYVESCEATDNADHGFQMQGSQAVLEHVLAQGNGNGLYCYKSWPLVLNSTLRSNGIGMYALYSGPYLENCSVDSNGAGLNIIGDAEGIEASEFDSGGAEEGSNFVGGGATDHISVTLPARASVRRAGMNVTGGEIGDDAVIEDSYSQLAPAIWGDMLVWQDNRDGNWDIYAYDLALDSDGDGLPNYLETPPLEQDGALVRITDEEATQAEPDIHGDTVVWTDFRNGNADIYAYCLANGTEWAVCTHPSSQGKPSVYGDKVAWQDYRSGNYDIYMMNLTTGEEWRLSDSADHDMSVRLSDDYAVWYSYHGSPPSNEYSDIWLFDFGSWTGSNINSDAALQYNPDIWEDTVVWHDNTPGNWEIYSCNVEDLAPHRLTYDPEAEQNFMPRIHGNRIAYYFHNRFTEMWSVRLYDTAAANWTTVEMQTNGDSVPVVHGDRVAWLNKSGNLNDIYVLDLGLGGCPEDVCLDVNADGSAEFSHPGGFAGTEAWNSTGLADALNLRLGRMCPDSVSVAIRVVANGTGRVTLDSLDIAYDVPTYIVSSAIVNSTDSGAYCYGSSPAFVNSSFGENGNDFTLNSEARPRTLNSTFSESAVAFMDALSNLTVQNFLHVRAQNLTGQPLDVTVIVTDNGQEAVNASTGPGGQLMWNVVTDRTHNLTGGWDNVTIAEARMGGNIFTSNPRPVDMALSHWETFSTDSVGPECSDMHPQPGWTSADLRPEISAVITDNLGIDYSSVRLFVQGFMVFYSATPVPGGYNISYQHPSDFLDGQVIACRIYCMDVHGNELDFAWDFMVDSDAEYFVSELQPGWNLISLPFDSYDNSVGSRLWSLSGSYDSVKAYSGGAWQSYRVGTDPTLDTLTTMERTRGYWVHVSQACVLQVSGIPAQYTSVPLAAGWNLVGYPTLNGSVTVSGALWGTGADMAMGFDPGSPYLISVLQPNYVMKPGEGYWIHVPMDTIWTVDW